ncbi:hypothetical protein GGR58DRAFT_527669 [Xylaria digitata]|nr:hypothetical protein GGR58DRAFT_527669 [Xylaria digitata]
MKSKSEIAAMPAPERELYEAGKEERAARKRLRTSWRTDATEKEKETALRVAINKMGGGKKYSWLQQGPQTVAETLGQKRAIELGIKSGSLAKELKIGEYREEGGGPRSLTVNWHELRGAGINMSKEEFAQSMRDAGSSEEEIRIATSPLPKKIVGRSAASVREKSGSPLVASVETPFTPITPTKSTKSTSTTPITPSTSVPITPTVPAPSRKGRGKKRAIGTDAEGENPAPTKKRKGKAKAKAKATVPSAKQLPTPSASSSPHSPTPSAPTMIDLFGTEEYVPSFAPRSPSISELEALLDVDDSPSFAPRSPSISELEAMLDAGDSPACAPRSPSISELEALLDVDDSPSFAPRSPSVSELEALLDAEE